MHDDKSVENSKSGSPVKRSVSFRDIPSPSDLKVSKSDIKSCGTAEAVNQVAPGNEKTVDGASTIRYNTENTSQLDQTMI